jgi:hypothetical protein
MESREIKIEDWKYEFDNWIPRLGSTPKRIVYSHDTSESYEMNRSHVFELENGKFGAVTEQGCSCYESSDADIEIFASLADAIKKAELIHTK